MNRPRAIGMLALAALVVAGAGGCGYQVHDDAASGVATLTFAQETYVGLIAIPVLVAVVAAGVLLVSQNPKHRKQAVIALVIDLLAIVLVVPGIWMDRVTLDAQGVTQRTGFWWKQTVKGFHTADVREIHIVRKEKRSGRRRRMETIWELHEKNGTTREIDPGDLWENASGYLVPKLRERGVIVQDHRP